MRPSQLLGLVPIALVCLSGGEANAFPAEASASDREVAPFHNGYGLSVSRTNSHVNRPNLGYRARKYRVRGNDKDDEDDDTDDEDDDKPKTTPSLSPSPLTPTPTPSPATPLPSEPPAQGSPILNPVVPPAAPVTPPAATPTPPAADPISEGLCVVQTPKICFNARKLNETTAQISFSVYDVKQYFALGIGSSMSDADVFAAFVSSSGSILISDRYSSNYVSPTSVETQDLVLDTTLSIVDTAAGKWTAVFTRPLTVKDPITDKDLTTATAGLIWAYGPAPTSTSATAALSYHTARGTLQTDLFAVAPEAAPGGGEEEADTPATPTPGDNVPGSGTDTLAESSAGVSLQSVGGVFLCGLWTMLMAMIL